MRDSALKQNGLSLGLGIAPSAGNELMRDSALKRGSRAALLDDRNAGNELMRDSALKQAAQFRTLLPSFAGNELMRDSALKPCAGAILRTHCNALEMSSCATAL